MPACSVLFVIFKMHDDIWAQVKWDGDYKPFSGSAVEQSNQLKQGSSTRPASSLQV
jgi:hypothetical protein